MKRYPLPKTNKKPGYSLVLLVVLVTALVAVTANSFTKGGDDLDEQKASLTVQRYELLKQSIVGPSDAVSLNGNQIQTGFVSDTGKVPPNLDYLVSNGGIKTWSVLGNELKQNNTDSFTDKMLPNISIYDGWRGPYFVSDVFGNVPKEDGWGSQFMYSAPANDGFNNGAMKIYSAGKDSSPDSSSTRNGYNDDYPFSASEKSISNDFYSIEPQLIPANIHMKIDIPEDERCEYYLGVIYPGLDLSTKMGGDDLVGSCDGEPAEEDDEPTDPIVPPLGLPFSGSITNLPPAMYGNPIFRGDLHVQNGINFSLKANRYNTNTDLSKMTGRLMLKGQPSFYLAESSQISPLDRITILDGPAYANDYRVSMYKSNQIREFAFNSPEVQGPELKSPSTDWGTTDYTISSLDDSIADFSTIRDLTLQSNRSFILPSGIYRDVEVLSGNLILGDPDADQPTVYDFESLKVPVNGNVVINGPVEIRTKYWYKYPESFGNPLHPEWLVMHTAANRKVVQKRRRVSTWYGYVYEYYDVEVAVNADIARNTTFYGSIIAPNHDMNIGGNATVTGNVFVDYLCVVDGSRLLNGLFEEGEVEGYVTPEDKPEVETEARPDPDSIESFNEGALSFGLGKRNIVPLSELDVVNSDNQIFKLTSKGEPLYFTNSLARRCQLVVFHKKRDEGRQASDSLAGRMASVYPKVFSFSRSSDAAVSTPGEGPVSPSIWRITHNESANAAQ